MRLIRPEWVPEAYKDLQREKTPECNQVIAPPGFGFQKVEKLKSRKRIKKGR